MPCTASAEINTASSSNHQVRRRGATARDRCHGMRLRKVWVSQGNGIIEAGRLEGQSQACGTHLASGRVESASETAQTQAVVAERWFLYPLASRAKESCLELRFCGRQDQ